MFYPQVGTELRSAIIGMVAGDAYFLKQGHTVNLKIVHSWKEKELLEYKRDILQLLFREWKIAVYPWSNKHYRGVYLIARDHPRLRTICKWFYKGEQKTITENVLRYLTPIGIAIWYMDHGSLSWKKRKGKVHGREVHLNTYCSYQECAAIQKYFAERWAIRWVVVQKKDLYRLRMGASEAQKFFALIAPYILPCMQYKIDAPDQRKLTSLEAPDTLT